MVKDLKTYCYCVLSERLILFSVSSYLDDLTVAAIDFLYDWNLLKNGQISGNIRCLNKFLEDSLTNSRNWLEFYAKSNHMKLYFVNIAANITHLTEYIKDFDKFVNKITRYCKKYLCMNKIIPDLSEFSNIRVEIFEGLQCLDLTGNDLEKILKTIASK